MPITQKNRLAQLATPLGNDVLCLVGMTGSERLGRLFQYELELVSENKQVKPSEIIGQNVTIKLTLPNNKERFFNGYVSRFIQIPSPSTLVHYKATVVPWLWFLTRVSDCRMFQDEKVPDIIKKIFNDRGFTDIDDKLTGSYAVRTYCVQYRETDFNFVSRLMEQEGIYYFFKHDNGKHTLVLADAPSNHEDFPDYTDIKFRPFRAEEDKEVIYKWHTETSVQPGAYALNDYDFTATKKDLLANALAKSEKTFPEFEVYDYPGEYTELSNGEKFAKYRIEELQSQYEVAEAQSDARGIATGCTFNLKECSRDDQNKKYMIISASYSIQAGDFESDAGTFNQPAYTCRFNAIDATVQFRTPRTTPKPTIPGPQTAVVVGPSGDEIYTDEHGRIKVKFHWDRYSKADEKSSCWIRVAQIWAGKNWGAMYLPRIGQEVVVEFLEGDPDQPIITGRVYNGSNMPPYALPGEKTKSTLKSNSSKGGEGFNEIRIEDKKGDEQIFIHAEKNIDIRVKNDRFETIDNDRHLHVVNKKFEHVENNRSETVDADHVEKIGKDRHLTVKGKEAKAVDGTLSLTVKGDVAEVFKSNHSEQTTKDYYLKAKNVVIEAIQNITLSCGGSYIAIEPASIEIKTSGQIKVEGTQVQIKGSATTKVEGGAMTEVKGGIVKIN